MTILLDDEDALFDAESFTLVHNEERLFVDPTVFFNFSRKFAQTFQYLSNNPQRDPETNELLPPMMVVNDAFDPRAFAAYVACCQMKPIAPSGIVLVDLLCIAEIWDSPTMIAKIESLLLTRVPPGELVRLFYKLLQEGKSTERIERIISLNLPRFIEAPYFSALPYNVIERMISQYPGKLTPYQLIMLCYAASGQGGIESIRFIKRYSFDGMDLAQVDELIDALMRCPYRQLKDFFYALGRFLCQLTDPIKRHNAFRESWDSADHGTSEQAFNFYAKVAAKIGELHNSATEVTFLKTAADRGHGLAQYHYGKVLLEHARTEEQEDTAVEYLIQAAAKGVKGAAALLEPYFTLGAVESSLHSFVYQNLSLQIVLLGMNADNIDASRQSLMSLNFCDTDERVLLLAQNIMKAIQIRQRSETIYADLIGYLGAQTGYEKLKQDIFTLIIQSLFTNEPRRTAFINLHFLFILQQREVYSTDEIATPLIDFLKTNAPVFVRSAMMVFYWFAPIIDEADQEIFTFLFMKQLVLERGMFGNLDPFMLEFKKSVRRFKDNNWEGFTQKRSECYHRDPIARALVFDDLAAFKKMAEQPGFDLDQQLDNFIVDLAPPTGERSFDDHFTLIQFAAMQGSKSCFLYLLRRGALFLENHDPASATCAAIGQCKFILGFITDVEEKTREEMFRMAGRFNNMYLMVLLLQNPIDLNSCDDHGSTSLHFATRSNNNGIVELLCHTTGIDVNEADDNGVTPFHFAVFGGKLELARIFAGVEDLDVNAQDRHGSTPLHYAVWNNDLPLVRFLLSLPGIDVNTPAKLNRTPLHEAAKCGFLEIVRALCGVEEIDLNPKDRSGRTPLKLAMKRKQIDVVQFLNQVEGIEKISGNLSESNPSETEKQTDYMHGAF